MFTTRVLLSTLLPLLALAKTDIGGCTSSATRNQWGEASMIYWLPSNHEICEILDCGGGRAPPKYSVPGCAAYTGTDAYQPRYMPGWGPEGQIAEATPSPEVVAQTSNVAQATDGGQVPVSSDAVEVPASGVVSEGVTPTDAAATLITEAPVLSGMSTVESVVATITTPVAGAGNATQASSSAPVQQSGNAAVKNIGGAMGLFAGAVAGLAML